MQNLMHEVKNIMSEELGLYVGLLQYAKGKKDALVNNDVDEISRLSKLESESLDRIKSVAAQRETLFCAIAQEDGFDGRVDIAYLLARLPAHGRGELETLRDRYKEVVHELKELNTLNQNLLRMQLQYASFCIDAVMQMEPVSGTYASSGQMSAANAAPRRLIEREA